MRLSNLRAPLSLRVQPCRRMCLRRSERWQHSPKMLRSRHLEVRLSCAQLSSILSRSAMPTVGCKLMSPLWRAGGREVDDVDQMMRELERVDSDYDAEGHGDLLDDFVSSALVPVCFCNDANTLWLLMFCAFCEIKSMMRCCVLSQASRHRPSSQKLATVPESEVEDLSSEGVSDDTASSLSDHSHADLLGDGLVSHGNRRGSSIASTYWRPQRTDRTEISSVLDDRCRLQDSSLPSQDRLLGTEVSRCVHKHTSMRRLPQSML